MNEAKIYEEFVLAFLPLLIFGVIGAVLIILFVKDDTDKINMYTEDQYDQVRKNYEDRTSRTLYEDQNIDSRYS